MAAPPVKILILPQPSTTERAVAKIPLAGTIAGTIRHLRRYQHIFNVFMRHGFGFALAQLPAEPGWLRGARPAEPATLPCHFRQALEELGPTFVKLGQVLSTRPDLLPPAYILELAKLRDAVPPVPWPEIRQVLETELSAPPETVFRTISPEPMAAASLGQVHAATLRDGTSVVVKVQRPHIVPTIETDLEILADVARYAARHTPLGRIYHLEEVAEEFAETLHNELDYRREARNADRFRTNFAGHSYLYIPRIYWDYTSARVMVMERIQGINLDNVAALDAAGHDRHRLATNASRATIKEVLEDGFFHADPHPGNLLVLENGAIGVLDFGMVGHISRQDRLNLARLYAVVVRLDAEGMVEELIRLGAASADIDRPALTREVQRFLNHYYALPLREIRAGEVLNEVLPIAFKYHLHLPTNLWLLAKTLTMTEGVGVKLDPDFDIFAFSSPYITRLLLKTVLPNRDWVEATLREGAVWSDLAQEVPRMGLRLLKRLEKREPLVLALDDHSLRALDRLVTRVALSLIITGMIVGLALLVPVTAESGIFLQAIVILGFILSLGLGGWVLLSIFRGQ